MIAGYNDEDGTYSIQFDQPISFVANGFDPSLLMLDPDFNAWFPAQTLSQLDAYTAQIQTGNGNPSAGGVLWIGQPANIVLPAPLAIPAQVAVPT